MNNKILETKKPKITKPKTYIPIKKNKGQSLYRNARKKLDKKFKKKRRK